MNKERTKHTIQLFDNCAQEYQDKFMSLNLYEATLDLFCESINIKNATILDAACGPGNIAQYLLSKRSDFKLLGIDLSKKMIDLAKVNNPDATFKIWDCKNISQLSQRFDAIICGFGLPYLSKEETLLFIEDCPKLLNEKGILYISTMEGDYKKSSFVTPSSGDADKAMFTHYHEAEYLISALQASDFEILDVSRKLYQYNNGNTNNDLIIISKLKRFN